MRKRSEIVGHELREVLLDDVTCHAWSMQQGSSNDRWLDAPSAGAGGRACHLDDRAHC